MSYTILTWDDTRHSIDDKNAKNLIEQWSSSDKSFVVNIGSEAFSSSTIKSITQNRLTEADLPKNDPSMRLKSDNRTDEQIYTAARTKAESVREILKRKGLKLQ